MTKPLQDIAKRPPDALVINEKTICGEGAHSKVFEGTFHMTPEAIKQFRKGALDNFRREHNFYKEMQRMQM